MRQIHIFFRFSKVILQFVWLFPCFVRVANPFVNLKLHLCYITLRIYRNQNKNNFTFSVQFTNLTKRRNKHCRALEILKKIWIYGSPIYLAACTFKIGMNSAGSTLGIFLKDMCDLHEIVTGWKGKAYFVHLKTFYTWKLDENNSYILFKNEAESWMV